MMSKDVDEKSRCHAVPLCVPRVWTVVERDVGRRTVDVALSSPRVGLSELGEVVPMISWFFYTLYRGGSQLTKARAYMFMGGFETW